MNQHLLVGSLHVKLLTNLSSDGFIHWWSLPESTILLQNWDFLIQYFFHIYELEFLFKQEFYLINLSIQGYLVILKCQFKQERQNKCLLFYLIANFQGKKLCPRCHGHWYVSHSSKWPSMSTALEYSHSCVAPSCISPALVCVTNWVWQKWRYVTSNIR